MNSQAQATGGSSFQQYDGLAPQHSNQTVVQLDLLQLGYQPILLLA
jgi:hypothetical protein